MQACMYPPAPIHKLPSSLAIVTNLPINQSTHKYNPSYIPPMLHNPSQSNKQDSVYMYVHAPTHPPTPYLPIHLYAPSIHLSYKFSLTHITFNNQPTDQETTMATISFVIGKNYDTVSDFSVRHPSINLLPLSYLSYLSYPILRSSHRP